MIGYVPRLYFQHDTPPEAVPTEDPPTYAHPSRALSAAQALAGDGAAAAVLLVPVDSEAWSACCGECLMAVNGRHDCSRRRGDLVFVWEAVYRPAGTVRARAAAPVAERATGRERAAERSGGASQKGRGRV